MREATGPAVRAVATGRVRRSWRALVAIGVVTGLVAGLSIAAFAGARRSSTAYDRLLARSDFPDAFVQLIEPRAGLVGEVASLPSVERAVPSVFAVGLRTDADGQVLIPVQTSSVPAADLPVIEGRAAAPGAADEVVLSPRFAEQLGLEVGDRLTHRALTDAEFADLLRDRWDGSASGVESALRVVGLVRTPTDVALAEFPTLAGTPALHDRLDPAVDGSGGVWVHLRPGADGPSLRAELEAAAGASTEERVNGVNVIDLDEERRVVDDAVAVLAGGMVAFGVLVALAGAVVAAQLAGRIADDARADAAVTARLGLDRRARRRAWLLAGWPVLGSAAVTAVVVAVAASAGTPLGVSRSIEPSPGIDVNLAFVAGGLVALGVTTAAIWAFVGRERRAEARRAARRAPVVATAGPTSTVAVSLALGSGGGRSGRWLGLAGVGASITGVVAASVFGSSLADLVDDPRRWGWFGELSVEVPEPVRDDVYAALDAAPEVEAYAEVRSVQLTIEGRDVAGYGVVPRRGDASPIVLRGRAPASAAEIALGPRLADELGVTIGDRVRTDAGDRVVVGLAPTFGMSELSDNAGGALLGGEVADAEFTTAVVRVADGVDPEGFGAAVYADAEYGRPVVPADVGNLRELGALTPTLLATFSVLGLAAVAHLARSTADRGRRDVAVLRALGLPRRRAAASVLGATAIAALLATAAAAPLGAVAGARAWSLVGEGADLGAPASAPAALWIAVPVVASVVLAAGAAAGRRAVGVGAGTVLRRE